MQAPPPQSSAGPDAEAGRLESGHILRLLKRVLYNGFPVLARFAATARVDSGYVKTDATARPTVAVYSKEDTTPAGLLVYLMGGASQAARRVQLQTIELGVVTAGILELQPYGGTVVVSGITSSGATNAMTFYDRTTPFASFVQFYRNGASFYASTNETADVWTVNATTGSLAQPGFTASTLPAVMTNYGAPWPTAGSRILKPVGNVEGMGTLNVGAAGLAAGGTMATLPAGHYRSARVPIWFAKLTGAAWSNVSGYIETNGAVVSNVALANGDLVAYSFQFNPA